MHQHTLTTDSETANGLLLIKTAIPGLNQQFYIFLHPVEIDNFAMAELLSIRINHPALTSRIVQEYSQGGLCGPEVSGKRLAYDIGGNIGYMSLLLASLGADVVGIEPTAFHGSLFQASTALNPHLSKNIQIVRAALTDRFSSLNEVCMELPDKKNAGFTRVSVGDICPDAMRAPLQTLDLLFAKYGSHPCAIKVDVEGFELNALMGGVKTLERNPPNFVVLEYNGYTSADSPADLARRTIDFFFKTMKVTYYMEDISLPGTVFKTKEDCLHYLSPEKPPYGDELAKWNTDLIFFRSSPLASFPTT